MKDFMINFLLRVVFGAIAIYLCNNLLFANLGLPLNVGLNPWNLLTIGTLGISGFGLVFTIALFSIL